MRNIRSLLLVSTIVTVVLEGCRMSSSSHQTLTGNFDAMATATMSSMTTPMSLPMLNFSFGMAEGKMVNSGSPMMNPGSSPTASVSISNLNFTTGSNCFDNMAAASAVVTGAAGANRTLTLMLSENGNTAMFTMTVPPNNDTASGNFALTGGNMVGMSTTPCTANASGTATFSRQ